MTRPDRRAWIVAAVAGVIAFAIALPFLSQGLDLVDEGRWLLGARLVLDGQDLHAHVADTGSGLREHTLAAWMRVFGEEASSLASLRAAGFALATTVMVALGTAAGGTAAGLAVFVAALATLPLAAGPELAWIVVGIVLVGAAGPSRPRAVLAGAGLAALFLVDLRSALVLIPAALMLFSGSPEWRARGSAVGAGALAVLVVTAVLAAVSQRPSIALQETFVAPFVQGLGSVDLGRALRTAVGGAWLDLPFVGLRATGEDWSAAWPAHGVLRATALRLLVVLSPVLIVVALAARARGRERAAVTAAVGAAVTATWILLLRGDVPSVRSVAPLVVLAIVFVVGRRPLIAALAGLVCLPLAAEPVWMTLHRDRPSLERFEGVAFDAARAQRLRSMRTALDPPPRAPLLVWPELPGVHWVLGTTPAGRHLDVPETEDDDRELAASLRRTMPGYVLLGFSRELLGHNLQAAAPQSWAVLREAYRLRGRVLGGDEDLRVMTPAGRGHAAESEGMANQLPMVELTVANERSPALREDFGIGQGFRSGPRDVEGFAFRARTSGRDVSLRLRVQVWEKKGDRYHTMLEAETVETTIVDDGQVVFIEFPVPESANRDLGISMEVLETPSAEIRFDWRADDDPREPGDLYPAGDALLALRPVDADLYFLVY